MATVPSSHDFTSGVATTSEANAYIRDPIAFLLNKPAFQLYSAAVQSIPNNAYTALTFDTERLDSDPSGAGGHSTTVDTSRFTAVYAGWYWVAGRYTYAANATGFRGAVLAVNGTQRDETRAFAATATAANSSHLTALGLVFLNVSDYVEVMAIQNTGAGLNTDTGNSALCSLSGFWVRNA